MGEKLSGSMQSALRRQTDQCINRFKVRTFLVRTFLVGTIFHGAILSHPYGYGLTCMDVVGH